MDIHTIRQAFPILTNHPDLVYLDSAATALKPASVIKAETEYYEHYSSNIARGIYPMAERATEAFETTRTKVAALIGASPEEIVFTSGTTHSLNLAADLLAARIEAGDNIVITAAEHHSNFLPWKELAKKKHAELRILPVQKDGTLDLASLATLVDSRTETLCLSAVSNVLGIINPVAEIVRAARSINPEIIVLVDAAQAVGHIAVDVRAWDADFVAFSGHKMFGPTGTGILYGKHALLETLSPTAFGGGMVLDACADEPLYKESPARFEAGTPNIAGIIGLGSAVDFIESIGLPAIRAHEAELITYALRRLKEEFGGTLQIIGTTDTDKKSGIISFTLGDVHPHDTAHLLGEKDICVRAGLQCAAPLHEALDLSATTRISLSVYNTEEDIEKLIAGIKAVRTVL